MTKPCRDCQHYQSGHHCKKKDAPTERARIMNTERADCFEIRASKTKTIEVK